MTPLEWAEDLAIFAYSLTALFGLILLAWRFWWQPKYDKHRPPIYYGEVKYAAPIALAQIAFFVANVELIQRATEAHPPALGGPAIALLAAGVTLTATEFCFWLSGRIEHLRWKRTVGAEKRAREIDGGPRLWSREQPRQRRIGRDA